MKRILFLLTLLSFSTHSLAMDVWITTETALPPEKMKEITADLPEDVRKMEIHWIYDELLRSPMDKETSEKVALLISQAEEESLNGRFSGAIGKYELLLKELDTVPNILGLQKTRFHIFVKLAELYTLNKDTLKSELYWKRAKAWDPKGLLDPEIFSPKSILKLKNTKTDKSLRTVKIKSPVHGQFFWNGKKIPEFDNEFDLKVTAGKHQISALIPGSSWQIKNFQIGGSSAENVALEFKENSILSGSCASPLINNYKLPKNSRLIAVFQKENCSRVFDGHTWYDLKGQKIEKDTAETVALNKIISDNIDSEKKSWISKLSHSTWFWVGLGALATAGTILYIKNQEPTVEPTHTYNYTSPRK